VAAVLFRPAELSGGTARLDRAVRVLGDLASHPTHHQPGEAARATGAQDQHVGVLARVDELLYDEGIFGPRWEWPGPSIPTRIPDISFSFSHWGSPAPPLPTLGARPAG